MPDPLGIPNVERVLSMLMIALVVRSRFRIMPMCHAIVTIDMTSAAADQDGTRAGRSPRIGIFCRRMRAIVLAEYWVERTKACAVFDEVDVSGETIQCTYNS